MMVLTTGGRRGVDLGRLDPSCPAPRHGTATAYFKAKCRCPHAREAHRLYQKRQRAGRLQPALPDATGTRRRVQGLWRLGHTSQVIVDQCDGRFDRQQVVRFCQQETVTPGHRESIAAAYRVLMLRPGKSVRTRMRAEAAGYALPVQWGDGIDDPAVAPEPLDIDMPTAVYVDEDAVELALAGAKVPLSDEELVVAVRAGVARGLSVAAVAGLLCIDFRAVRTIAGGATPPRFGALVRRRLAVVRSAA